MNKFSPSLKLNAREELVCARSDQISKWSEKYFETATERSFQPGPKRDLIKFNRMPCFSSYKREYFNTLPDHVHSGESRGPVIAVSRSLHNLRYGKSRKNNKKFYQKKLIASDGRAWLTSWTSLVCGTKWDSSSGLSSLVVTMLSS